MFSVFNQGGGSMIRPKIFSHEVMIYHSARLVSWEGSPI